MAHIIEAWGARGGDAAETWLGANGAFMSSEFSLVAEDNFKILVGQKGSDGEVSSGNYFGGGGGGASFIHLNGNVVLVSGGGGGAGIGETGLNGFHGSIALTSESGNNANGTVARANGLPGTNGSAGTAGQYYGGAGGGSVSHSGQVANNSSASGGTSWMLGGAGGLFGSYNSGNSASGGFGGGGASLFGGGGGGGYSGGPAGTHGASYNATGGGGGGSYNSGTNQNNQAGANAGDGKVVITLISSTSTQSGGGSYQSPTSGYQSPDSISITYPDVGTLYESASNGLSIDWNYQSQSNDMQSLSWAYKLDEDFYGTGTSATQVNGTDSVDGSSWLSGVSYGIHTLYVALLDQEIRAMYCPQPVIALPTRVKKMNIRVMIVPTSLQMVVTRAMMLLISQKILDIRVILQVLRPMLRAKFLNFQFLALQDQIPSNYLLVLNSREILPQSVSKFWVQAHLMIIHCLIRLWFIDEDPAWLLVTTIDNWSDSQNSTEIENLGFAPSNNLEPALISTLQPGIYMVMVMSETLKNLDEGFVELLVKDMNPSTSIDFQNIYAGNSWEWKFDQFRFKS